MYSNKLLYLIKPNLQGANIFIFALHINSHNHNCHTSGSSSQSTISLRSSSGTSQIKTEAASGENRDYLLQKREHLIKLLQDENIARKTYYQQLESITQKINSIPIDYSLQNEAERQKYELQAERIRQEMNARLGNPNEG